MKKLALFAGLAPGAAFAHGGHPIVVNEVAHGLTHGSIMIVAVALIVAVLVARSIWGRDRS